MLSGPDPNRNPDTRDQQRGQRQIDDRRDDQGGTNHLALPAANRDDGAAQAEVSAFTATPLSLSVCCNSPAWNISRTMSQPPTNSPFT